MITPTREIEQIKDIEDVKAMLRLVFNAINQVEFSSKNISADLIFRDGGPVIRSNDGNYYRIGLSGGGGSVSVTSTLIGKNPKGEQ